MIKLIKWPLLISLSLLISLLIYLAVFEFYAFNSDFYTSHFLDLKVQNIVGVTEAELVDVTHALVSYINNGTGDIHIKAVIDGASVEYFNPKEQAHLNDIKVLIKKGRQIKTQLIIVTFVLFSIAWILYRKSLTRLLPMIAVSSILMLAFLGILYLIDFDWAFRRFHELLFYNNLWLLNPYRDRLLQMMPLEFFMIFTQYLLGTVFLINLLLLVLYKLLNRPRRFFIKQIKS